MSENAVCEMNIKLRDMLPEPIRGYLDQLEAENEALRERLRDLTIDQDSRVSVEFLEDYLTNARYNRRINVTRIPEKHVYVRFELSKDWQPGVGCISEFVTAQFAEENRDFFVELHSGSTMSLEPRGENRVRVYCRKRT